MSRSKIVEYKVPCPLCGSSDALTTYDNGLGHCFSCGVTAPVEKFSRKVKKVLDKGEKVGYHNSVDMNSTSSKQSSLRGGDTPLGSDTPKVATYSMRNITSNYRGLSPSTFNFYGVRENPEKNELIIPYGDNAYKARSYSTKNFHTSGQFREAPLFGMDKFNKGSSKAITITEGEIDAMSVFQMLGSQYPSISIKNGAAAAANDCEKHRDYINSFEKIYLCFDNDDVGREAQSKVASLFDPNKVYIVDLTKHKDANDYLVNDDQKEFQRVWWNAKRFRPKNIISGYDEVKAALEAPGSDVIAHYPFPRLDEMACGIQEGQVVLVTAPEKIGKGLALDTRIPTPTGWTTIGDLKTGDALVGRDGKPCRVTYLAPIQKLKTFLITFQDGTSIVADAPHRWLVRNLEGKELVTDTETMFNVGPVGPGSRARFMVPCPKALELPEADLPVDPLLLGAWLADGHSYSAYITLPPKKLAMLSSFTVRREYRYGKDTCPNYMFNELKHSDLLDMDLLKNKHVPDLYLRSSVTQRQRLMDGMMFDGWKNEFYTSRESLRDGFLELARSLGYTCKVRDRDGHYTVRFKRKDYKAIRSIAWIEDVETRCLTVDSPDHLFVVGDGWTCTHNTEFLRAIEYHLLKTTDYNLGIIHLEEKEKRAIQGLVGYELKTHVHRPDSNVSNEEQFEAYMSLTKRDDRVYFYQHFGSEDPDVILDVIRNLVTTYKCKFIFLDHITMLATGFDGDDERRKLDYISTRLAMLTRELGFTLFLVSHVNDDGKTRGSRNISKICSINIYIERDKESPDPMVRNTINVMIRDNRDGSDTGPSAPLRFDRDTFTISESEIAKYEDTIDPKDQRVEGAPMVEFPRLF
jgi:replicative DNA helicase